RWRRPGLPEHVRSSVMTAERFNLDKATHFVGQELGASDWILISQPRINEFADCTGDDQWIHVDVERAKRESPSGPPSPMDISPWRCSPRPPSKSSSSPPESA